jgi:hypothetical protein
VPQALITLETPDGGSVLVEAEPVSQRPVTRGQRTRGDRTDQAVAKAGASLETVLGRVGPSVAGIVAAIRESTAWPDEVQVEFSVKISTDANVIIARSGGEANFKIALKWSGGRGDG